MSIHDRAASFRQLHQLHGGSLLVLPNAWDAASARLAEQAGAKAVATTSAGVSWSLGYADGQQVDRAEAVAAVRRIVRAVSVPVTADIESGYGAGSLADVVETVRAIVDAGAVGVNLEDSPGSGGAPLLAPEEQAERLRAARAAADAAGVRLFLNARTDVYLAGVGEPAGRLDDVVHRVAVYLEAGADGIFVPGIVDEPTIAALARAIPAPLNVLAHAGCLPAATLARLGVARVSLGSGIAEAAFGTARRAVQEALTTGTFPTWPDAMSYGEAQKLFR